MFFSHFVLIYQIISLEDLCKLRNTKLYIKTFTQASLGISLLFIYLKCSGILNVYTKHTVSLIWKTHA